MMHKYRNAVTASIVGARGYSGLETAKILLRHPGFKLTHAFATSTFDLSALLSSEGVKGVMCLNDDELMDNLTDVVFLATPAEVSLKLAPQILSAGKKVVDLSGAFRLKKSDYARWYGFDHHEPAWLERAHFGLVPWAQPTLETRLVANPGCFATAVNMALIPLLKDSLIEASSLVIDAKSGATGAGKKAAENLLFTEVQGECLPYKIGKHQHEPEIGEAAERFGGQVIDAHFTTSLLGARRGIIVGLYARLREGVDLAQVEEAYRRAYADSPLVRTAHAEQEPQLLQLKKVVGTARTHITFAAQGSKLYVFSCLDNLMKGAASQAVENANLLFGYPAETGLTDWEAMI